MFTKKRYCALSSRPVVASWTAALKHTLTAFAADAALMSQLEHTHLSGAGTG